MEKIMNKDIAITLATGVVVTMLLTMSVIAQNFNASATILSPPTCGLGLANVEQRTYPNTTTNTSVASINLGPVPNFSFGIAFPGQIFLNAFVLNFTGTGNINQTTLVQGTNWTSSVGNYSSNFTIETNKLNLDTQGLGPVFGSLTGLNTTPRTVGSLTPSQTLLRALVAGSPFSQPPGNYTQQIVYTSVC